MRRAIADRFIRGGLQPVMQITLQSPGATRGIAGLDAFLVRRVGILSLSEGFVLCLFHDDRPLNCQWSNNAPPLRAMRVPDKQDTGVLQKQLRRIKHLSKNCDNLPSHDPADAGSDGDLARRCSRRQPNGGAIPSRVAHAIEVGSKAAARRTTGLVD